MSMFARSDFKSFSAFCSENSFQLYVAINMGNSDTLTFGDAKAAIGIFKKSASTKKMVSGDWIPDKKEVVQKKPLCDYYMNINEVKKVFRLILRQFIGKDKIGVNENGDILWGVHVPKGNIPYSSHVLKKCGFRASDVCLDDVLSWSCLNSENITKPPAKKNFKLNFR